MYRIINHSQTSNEKASNVFALRKGIQSTPRRYWNLQHALKAACKKGPGIYEIQDDERHWREGKTVAVVKNGKILAQK